jgi:hypothetical protein
MKLGRNLRTSVIKERVNRLSVTMKMFDVNAVAEYSKKKPQNRPGDPRMWRPYCFRIVRYSDITLYFQTFNELADYVHGITDGQNISG